MQSDRTKSSEEAYISDSNSDPDWNEQLISAVRQREGKSRNITEQNRLERIRDCLNEGADINAIDKDGNTVLHVAVKRNWIQIIKFLLCHGARTNIRNRRGQTATAVASINDKQEIVNILNLKEPNRSNQLGEQSVTANDFSSVNNPKNLSIFDHPNAGSDQSLLNLKRKLSTNNSDFSENAKQRILVSKSIVNSSFLGEKILLNENITDVTHVPLEEKEMYVASGLKQSLHGMVYQLKHLMLILHRAWKLGYPFRLSTEMKTAEKFDDLVLHYRDATGQKVHRFVQVKHKQDESKEIRASDLLTQGDGEFSVQKYFISWRRIRKHSDFIGSRSKHFILCTNIGIDLEGLKKAGIVCTPELEPDEFLNIRNRSEQPPRYKLVTDKQSELYNVLQATSDVCKLARVLAQRVHDSKDLDLKTTIFKYYHTALAREVIDIDNKKFFHNFIKNINLSKKAQNFREIFFVNMQQLSKRDESDQNIWQSVEQHSLKLSATFGEEFKLAVNPELTEVTKFTQEFVLLLNNAERDNVVKIARTVYHKQAKRGSIQKIVADNIDTLAGHVLIRESGKLKFRSEFLDGKIQSAGNIGKFRDALKTQMGSKYKNLHRFEILINNFKTCEEEQLYSNIELPDDIIDDKEITDFLNELILAVNQPNEMDLGEMIASQIGADSQFNVLNGDFICNSFQKIMLDWFKQKGKDGVFLSNKDAEDFFNAIEVKVSSLITVGLNLAYSETLEKYGAVYRNQNNEVQEFLTSSVPTEPRILNLIAPDETLLTALRAHQTLVKLENYRKNDSFIFIRLETLLLTGVMNRVISAFESPHSYHLLLVDCGSTSANEASQKTWNSLCEIVEKYCDKRMIIITQVHEGIATQCKISVKICAEKPDNVSFNNLTIFSQQNLLEKSLIIFQGQKERTSLGKLLRIHIFDIATAKHSENSEGIIDSMTLVKLIRNEEIKIGDSLEGLGEIEDYYIHRIIFRQVIIKKDILKSQPIPDLFAISDIYRIQNVANLHEEISEINSTTDRQFKNVTIIDNDHHFRILCERNSESNIHWVYGDSEKLIWKQSQGNIDNLVKYRDAGDNSYKTGSYELTEDQLIVFDENRKIVIISSTAGMGKSTILTYLAGKMKANNSDLLVININLAQYTIVLAEEKKNATLERGNVNKAVDFLVKKFMNCETSSEEYVIKRMIKHGRAALCFDGFDEISPNYENTVIDLLQEFSKLPIKKLFVTTRTHTREVLEMKLNAFAYTMEPFSAANQVEFLTNFWKKKLNLKNYDYVIEERSKMFAMAVIELLAKSIDDWMNELTGVPLQTRMVAEIFGDIGDGKLRDVYVCEEFLNSEAKEPKLPDKIDLIDLYRSFIDKKYYIYRTEKRKDDPTNLGVEEDSKDLRQVFLKRHERLALCTLFDEEDLKELLSPNCHQEIFSDVLGNKLKTGRERTGIVTEIINNKPYFIHYTFAEYFTATFLIKTMKNVNQSEPAKKFFVSKILLKPEYKTIRAFLNCLLATENETLGNESWKFAWDNYCRNFDETVFHVGAAEGNCEIINFFLNCLHKYPADRKALTQIKDNTNRTALYLAAENKHWDAFRLLAQHGDVDINDSIPVSKPPLQIAASIGDLEVVKYLVEIGADVNCRDNFGFTPIDQGASCNHLDVVKYLIEKGAEINSRSNSGQTPIHWAAGRGNLDVLKYLVERGADVNVRDSFGMTPMFQSCLPGDLETIKYLVEKGANVNLPDMFGVTPLKRAASFGYWDVVRLLLAKGANSDCLDERSLTLLHNTRI